MSEPELRRSPWAHPRRPDTALRVALRNRTSSVVGPPLGAGQKLVELSQPGVEFGGLLGRTGPDTRLNRDTRPIRSSSAERGAALPRTNGPTRVVWFEPWPQPRRVGDLEPQASRLGALAIHARDERGSPGLSSTRASNSFPSSSTAVSAAPARAGRTEVTANPATHAVRCSADAAERPVVQVGSLVRSISLFDGRHAPGPLHRSPGSLAAGRPATSSSIRPMVPHPGLPGRPRSPPSPGSPGTG